MKARQLQALGISFIQALFVNYINTGAGINKMMALKGDFDILFHGSTCLLIALLWKIWNSC